MRLIRVIVFFQLNLPDFLNKDKNTNSGNLWLNLITGKKGPNFFVSLNFTPQHHLRGRVSCLKYVGANYLAVSWLSFAIETFAALVYYGIECWFKLKSPCTPSTPCVSCGARGKKEEFIRIHLIIFTCLFESQRKSLIMDL